MSEPVQSWKKRVYGFGSHVEVRTVEFVQSLDYSNVCNWCDVASLDTRPLHCRHVVCNGCYQAHKKYEYRHMEDYRYVKCVIDDFISAGEHVQFGPNRNSLADKIVRCLNADSGCEFMGRLGELDKHLRETCDLCFTPCSKCEESVVHKELRSHYIHCEGAPVVFISAAETQSLLQGIDQASEKLEQALVSSSVDRGDVLQTVATLVNEQFARISTHLTAPSGPRA